MSFIPKEKLTAYERWELAAFDEPEPEPAPEPAAPEAEKPPEPAPEAASAEETRIEAPEAPEASEPPEEVIQIALPTAEEIERIHDEAHAQGYSAGHAAGYSAGHEEGMAAAREAAARLEALTGGLSEAIESVEQEVADELLATALEIARQVLRQSLAVKPELILPVVREAMAALRLESGRPTLILHPDDAVLVRAQMGENLAHNDWRIIDDPALTRGGCRVELNESEVDASLESRWKAVVETLGARGDWLDERS